MHIGYDHKNGVDYAKLCISHRNGKKVTKEYINLGRVLDKDKGIYQNRERGVFTYDLNTNTYGKPPAEFVPDIPSRKKQELILDFGDTFFLDQYLNKSGLMSLVESIGYGNPDTLKSMLCYYILCQNANCYADDWWRGNYASILYPKANLTSQRISDFLASIGDEYSQREFFKAYFPYLESHGEDLESILIDSTGLPNNIHFPLTAISNHNGKISNEVRLIYIVQQHTGLPIYFRYCPGNVIDASTVVRCMEELKAQGVNTKFAILDAGYYTEDNIREFYKNNVSFITRLPVNRNLYEEVMEENLDTIECRENMVSYNGRYVYLKCVKKEICGHNAYVYIGLDIDRKSMESHKTFSRASSRKMSDADVYDEIHNQGIFMLVSSRKIARDKILPLYYTRQQIEQIFDVGKNYANLLPLRVQTEETFRGHLLLTFMAAVVVKQIQDKLLKTDMNPISIFLNLRTQKCKVYQNKIITTEANKKNNDCYKLFKIKCPVTIKR